MSLTKETPLFFLKYLQIIVLLFVILFFGKDVFVPMFYGLFIAMLFYPICKKMQNNGIPFYITIIGLILLLLLSAIAIVYLLVLEFKHFLKDFPLLVVKLKELYPSIQSFFLERGVSLEQQSLWEGRIINKGYDFFSNSISGWLELSIFSILNIVLIPLYTVLIITNRHRFFKAISLSIGANNDNKLNEIIAKTINTFYNYIKGMIMVYIIVGVLNSVGLVFLDVKYAIFFGILTAFMTIIPYFGIIIASLLPISVAWITTGDIYYPLAVIALFTFVQYLEANIIFPLVVGAQLNLNTWASLVIIFIGGVVWGINGMILFLPIMAIVKIISDYITSWKPFSVLLSSN